MFYDSMIAKLIVHGDDRGDAIRRMRDALNAFVIRGVSSNIPFQAALLAHPRFVSGDFNTGFIAEEYPRGFSTAQLPHDDPHFAIALAAAVHREELARSARVSGSRRAIREDFVVVMHGEAGARTSHAVRVREADGRLAVEVGGRMHSIRVHGRLRDVALEGESDGVPFCAQVEQVGPDLRIAHNGLTVLARVLTPRGAELYELMPHKPPPDMSRFLLSPMPGLLVDVLARPGQKVVAGEKLAVIEAMKMENAIFASQDGVVARVAANKGESLAVDQVIMEFE
jgi:propionyl-CoA carboxylase alpha chain